MALINAFGEVSLEATQQEIKDLADSINTLVQYLYANAPRRDAGNRLLSNGSEVTQPVSGTVTANVSTVASLTNLVSIGGYSPSNSMFGVPLHIYNQIEVT